MTIFTVPVRLAVQMGIPLDRLGREPAERVRRSGGRRRRTTRSTRRWLEEFGGLLGLRGQRPRRPGRHRGASTSIQYTYPSDEELARVGVTGIFLGYYMPWDGLQNAIFAQAHGFETWPQTVEGSLVNYENLDNHQTGIHDYFKFLKYGFGRATDIASCTCAAVGCSAPTRSSSCSATTASSRGRTSASRSRRCSPSIDMTFDEFIEVCDRFTNKRLFVTDRHGRARARRPHGNLTKINYDNVPADRAAAARRHRRLRHVQPRLGRGARSKSVGAAARTSPTTPPTSTRADRIVLPGVGAFPDAMAQPPRRAARRGAREAGARTRVRRSSASASACSCWPRSATRSSATRRASAGSTRDVVPLRRRPKRPARAAHRLERGDAGRSSRRCSTASRPARDFYFVHSFHVACADAGRRRWPRRRTAAGSRRRSQREQRVRRAVPPREEPAVRACELLRNFLAALTIADAQGPRHPHAALQGLRPGQGRAVRLAARASAAPMQAVKVYNLRERRRARVPRRHRDARGPRRPTSS